MGHFFLTPLFALICTLKHELAPWPSPGVLGHCLVLWQQKALRRLSCPVTPPTIMPNARGQPDPWFVLHCPQQGLAESCWEAHGPCLGPPPSHGRVAPSRDLVVEQLSPLQGYCRC